ncbi:MAG TPA: single-stranded-DNA-specific exonuclease RecJ [Candidatus Kapabacteria bacterium]|nr:single-stranded-DNA-specific exonuclease RecJ [Candidatus Kapabacteria bacterium]
MQKVWTVLPPPPQSFFDEHPELPKIVAHLLYHRNIRTQEQIDEFLHPDYSQDLHDPFLFRDMDKAVARIFSAIEKNERITIHGDYDADGVSGATILAGALKALGATNFTTFLPHRETDGYGLNMNTVQILAEEGTTLIITCDCGISNTEETRLANEKGIDVIITDHHAIPAVLPPAYAILHPKIEGEPYPDKGLAGGGVAFKLLQGLFKKHKETHETLPNGERHEAAEKWSLDMAAIASVADMVPLLGESRTLTHYGLIVLNKAKRLGLKKLFIETRLVETDGSKKREIDAETIGFHIAPRINAAGRMNHANVAYNLMTTEDPIAAIDLAAELNKNNQDRQKMTEEFVKEAIAQIEHGQKDKPVLCVMGTTWTTGIVGLIASRIKEKYQKPTIAMAMNQGYLTGSGRSVDGFNMIGAMQEMPEYFLKFGGHPMACGFTLKSLDVRDAFEAALRNKFQEKTVGLDLTPRVIIDAEVDLEDVNWELFDILEKFKPFGIGNQKPTYIARDLTVMSLKPVGKEGKHLTIMVKHKTHKIRKTIGWRLCDPEKNDQSVDWNKELKHGDKIDILFEIGVNEWNGNRELQLTIVDIRKSEPIAPLPTAVLTDISLPEKVV